MRTKSELRFVRDMERVRRLLEECGGPMLRSVMLRRLDTMTSRRLRMIIGNLKSRGELDERPTATADIIYELRKSMISGSGG